MLSYFLQSSPLLSLVSDVSTFRESTISESTTMAVPTGIFPFTGTMPTLATHESSRMVLSFSSNTQSQTGLATESEIPSQSSPHRSNLLASNLISSSVSEFVGPWHSQRTFKTLKAHYLLRHPLREPQKLYTLSRQLLRHWLCIYSPRPVSLTSHQICKALQRLLSPLHWQNLLGQVMNYHSLCQYMKHLILIRS